MGKVLTTTAALLILLFGALIGVATLSESSAIAAELNHPSLAPERPERGIPIAGEGFVLSTIQVGDRVIVAGEFSEVEAFRGGPIVERNNIFAYDINTGELIEDFNPNVDGPIEEMVAIPETGEFFIGGTFRRVGGDFRIRVAKLDYFGDLDEDFRAEASASVGALDVHEDVLFLGGSFAEVNGEQHQRIAAVDIDTGESVRGFNLQVMVDLGRAETRSVRALDVTPSGELLVAFNGQQIVDARGVPLDRFGLAFIDLDTYLVTDWRTEWYENSFERCSQQSLQLRDGELSPDGSFFVVVEKGNFNCDKAVAFDTVDDGVNNPRWVTAAHDSVFSVAVTNNAAYIGGHFCFITGHGPIPSSEAPTYPWVAKPEPCNSFGNETIDEFVGRYQIAALDPNSGNALDWNPTSNAQEAVFHVEAIDRGLLLGQDRNRVNQIRTGTHAFLDFGGTTPVFTPPPPPSVNCTANVSADGVVSIDWEALEDVSSYAVRRDGQWVTTTADTAFTDDPGVGSHAYTIRYRPQGVVTDETCSPTPVVVDAPAPSLPPAPFTCTATVDGDSVVLEWNQIDDVDRYQVRRDGGWIATSNGTSHVDANVAAGDYVYEIRYRIAGAVTDAPCSPTPVTVGGGAGPVDPGPAEVVTCSLSLVGDTATIEWNQIDDVERYQVRRDGGWIATSNGTSHVDSPSPAGATYEIRYRIAGAITDIACI